jgi:5-methylcytosine-specific restriction endonuclease McrA
MSNLRLNNPEKAKMIDRVKRENRRAHKQGSEGSYTQKDIQQIFAQQQGTCAYCHQQLTEYHIDHVVPLSRGGTNWPDNLALACSACNLSKGAKLLSEWIPNRH